MKHNARVCKRLFLTILVSTSMLLTMAASTMLMVHKISGTLVAAGDAYQYAITASSRYTAFIADASTDHLEELYSVPSWGGVRVLLSPGITAMHTVLDFILSPDGATAVYWVGFSEDELRAESIYAVPVAGGPTVDLTGAIAPGLYLEGIEISADSEWLFYTLGDHANSHVLYRVPLDGSATPAVISPTGDCQNVKFKQMPISHGVVYARQLIGLTGAELVYVDPSGISHPLASVSGELHDGNITLDGSQLIIIEQRFGISGDRLVSINLADSTRTVLNDTLVAGGNVIRFTISQDNGSVVYMADQDANDVFEIYTVRLDTYAVYPLIGSMVAGGDVLDYELIYQENKVVGVVYKADQLVDERFDLGSVSIDGSGAYLLSPGLPDTGDVRAFEVSPNGIGVAFIADYVDDVDVLWITSTVGGEPKPVGVFEGEAADWPSTADVSEFSFAPNSSYLVFLGNVDDQFTTELYIAGLPIGSWLDRHRINLPLVEDGSYVSSYKITPNSAGVVYRADQDVWGMRELYSAFYRYPLFLPMSFR